MHVRRTIKHKRHMERNLKSIIGYRIVAKDGEIGKLDDLYFEDDSWTIRYLVIKLEEGTSGRKALIPPSAMAPDQDSKGIFFVDHTKAEIFNSPNIDTDKPVSRQQEIELYGHYAWKGYWESGFYNGGLGTAAEPLPATGNRTGTDLHLRSSLFVSGFHVHGVGCEIGYIYDFILDDKTWQILDLVVDTRSFQGGKKILISVKRVLQMRWSDSEVYLAETEAHIIENEVFEPDIFNGPKK